MTTNPTKKWTSGPWKYGETVGGKKRVFDTNGWEVVRAMSQVGLNRRKPEETSANAHLIAASPELYEALAGLVEIIDKAGLLNLASGLQLGQTSWYVKANYARDYALATLTKARGETP